MLQLLHAPVIDQRLAPYVEGYGLLRLHSGSIHEKEILPWPGHFLLCINQPFELDGRAYSSGCLRGIHESASRLRWRGDDLEVFTVRFAPYGLRPFLRESVDRLADTTSEAPDVWNFRQPSIYGTIGTAPSLEARVTTVENFLLATLDVDGTDATDRMIMQLADVIKRDPSTAAGPARAGIPLSNRQFARRFRALTGINLRTYVRICRFAYAKTSLLLSSTPSLTDLGYEAGYFDQAHFSRDFTKLAEQSPKGFPGHYSLHRLISGLND